jgi:hypothetical protein
MSARDGNVRDEPSYNEKCNAVRDEDISDGDSSISWTVKSVPKRRGQNEEFE